MESKAPTLGEYQKITLYQDRDILLSCEEAGGLPFIHCEVESYSKSVLKRLKIVWQEMEEAFRAHGHVEVFTYAKKQPAKFAKMFGKPEVIDHINHLGDEYEVIRWDLQ